MNFLNFIVIFLTLSEADRKVANTYEKNPQSYNDYSFNLQSPATKTIFEFMVYYYIVVLVL